MFGINIPCDRFFPKQFISTTQDGSLNIIDPDDSKPKIHIIQELGRGEVLTVGWEFWSTSCRGGLADLEASPYLWSTVNELCQCITIDCQCCSGLCCFFGLKFWELLCKKNDAFEFWRRRLEQLHLSGNRWQWRTVGDLLYFSPLPDIPGSHKAGKCRTTLPRVPSGFCMQWQTFLILPRKVDESMNWSACDKKIFKPQFQTLTTGK
jgi:hypothetical protein